MFALPLPPISPVDATDFLYDILRTFFFTLIYYVWSQNTNLPIKNYVTPPPPPVSVFKIRVCVRASVHKTQTSLAPRYGWETQ